MKTESGLCFVVFIILPLIWWLTCMERHSTNIKFFFSFFLFTWKTLHRIDFCCWQRSTKGIQTYLPCLSLVTKQLYFTALTFKVFLFMKISLFMYNVFLQSYSIIVIGEMKFSPSRWKLHFDWTSFLMQSPINIMPSAAFLENGYRCDFWIDKKIEHLNVLGKADGIFV